MRLVMKASAVLVLCAFLPACLAAAPVTQPDDGSACFPRPADGREPRRIVFICENSGAAFNCWDLVCQQLGAKLNSLVDDQSFDLLFPQPQGPDVFSTSLVPASVANKQKAQQWIEDHADRPGTYGVIAAIEAAFALKPDEIYLLDNGDYGDNAAVIRRIDFLNKSRAVRINTTAMIGDEKDTSWTATLRTIARQNGGVYTPVKFNASVAGIGGSIFALAPQQARADRIVFLCDASGSMLNKYVTLRSQLSKAVAGLQPSQSFNLIFMGEADCTKLAAQPLKATVENKQAADSFLEDKVTPRGETNPIPALEAAFAQKPQVIFLLTDGDFPDNQAVMKRIAELDANHQVQINTIAFLSEADTDTDFLKLLQQIARENGGIYKHIDESKLGN